MEILYFLGIILAIFINYIIAKKFEKIANEKGHFDSDYFWYTFIFSFIGMLMVIALPDRQTKTVKVLHEPKYTAEKVTQVEPMQNQNAEVSKNLTPTISFEAPNKPDTNSNPAIPVDAIIDGDEKVCPHCGRRQKADRTVCWDCAQKFSN